MLDVIPRFSFFKFFYSIRKHKGINVDTFLFILYSWGKKNSLANIPNNANSYSRVIKRCVHINIRTFGLIQLRLSPSFFSIISKHWERFVLIWKDKKKKWKFQWNILTSKTFSAIRGIARGRVSIVIGIENWHGFPDTSRAITAPYNYINAYSYRNSMEFRETRTRTIQRFVTFPWQIRLFESSCCVESHHLRSGVPSLTVKRAPNPIPAPRSVITFPF